MNCLQDIIGLSRTTCSCFDDESNYNLSESGYYLDELEGMNILTLDKSTDCSTGSIWEMLEKAKTLAINDFQTDMVAALSQSYKASMKTFNGMIGKTNWSETRKVSYALSGLTLIPLRAQKGILKVNSVFIAMNEVGSYNGKIYSSEQNEGDNPLHTFTAVIPIAQKWTEVVIGEQLPMSSSDGGDIAYFIVIENNGVKVMNNALACCGFKPNCRVFGKEYRTDRLWYNYVKVGGVQGNDFDNLNSCKPMENYMNGMRLDVTISCDSKDAICDNLDFTGGGNAAVIAKALQYKAGYHLAYQILSSTTINRYTMMDREELFAKRNMYQKEYEARIKYLSTNLNVAENGCWTCDQRLAIVRV